MQQTGIRMEKNQQVRMPNDLYLATRDDPTPDRFQTVTSISSLERRKPQR